MSIETVYIALGSNLEQPVEQLQKALQRIAEHPDMTLENVSAFYRSRPVPTGDVTAEQAKCQPDYINAVAVIRTSLSADVLLKTLLRLENEQGRVRIVKGGSRTLDLDLLIYGNAQIQKPELIVPHPRMADRAFVLVPLADLVPDMNVPGIGALSCLLKSCNTEGLQRIDIADTGVEEAYV